MIIKQLNSAHWRKLCCKLEIKESAKNHYFRPHFHFHFIICSVFFWNSSCKNTKNEQNSRLYISNFTLKGCPNIFSFLVFSGTQSHLHARKISTLSDQPSMFIEKNTHFCCIIHLKIISYKNSVSSTPLAKKITCFGQKMRV